MNARSIYRRAQGENATPIRLIILLYEQLIADLRLAGAAIEAGNIENRTLQLSHALAVLGELEASLNLEAGQEVGQNLAHFYQVLRAGLLQVQFRPDPRAMEKHISNLLTLREAWVEVEKQQPTTPPIVSPAEGENDWHRSDWRV